MQSKNAVPELIAFGIGFMPPGVILAGLGFTAAGVTAGTIAAGWQGIQINKCPGLSYFSSYWCS